MTIPYFLLQPGDRLPDFELPEQGGELRKFYWAFRGEPVALLAVDSVPALLRSDYSGIVETCRRAGVALVLLIGAGTDAVTRDWSSLPQPMEGKPLFTLCDGVRNIAQALLAPAMQGGPAVQSRLLLLDANQRLLLAVAEPGVVGLAQTIDAGLARAEADEPEPALVQGSSPPVLILPRVFEPELCRSLIALWQHGGHSELGVSSRYGNVSMGQGKRTDDHLVSDENAIRAISDRLAYRIGPELLRGFGYDQPFGFDAHVILSYSAQDNHYFRAHRDNGAPQTADRAFAVSLNLNEDYEGGELVFPEYGKMRFKPPMGGAAVFSCTLLHEALPVTSGRRYVLTSFFRPKPQQTDSGYRTMA